MPQSVTNAERLNAAAEILRKRGYPGDEHAARMLELCEPIATYWSEPYAAPFVPLLEAALRLVRSVTPDPAPEPEAALKGRVRTVAVDFDGVVHAYSRGWHDGTIYDEPIPGALDALHALMRDYAVFIHTTREPEQVMPWLEGHGFDVTIDERCGACEGLGGRVMVDHCPACEGSGQLLFWNLQGQLLVTNRKLAATAYIDDRAVRFESWPQTLAEMRRRYP